MVGISSIVFMIISIILSIGLPIIMGIYFYRKYKISLWSIVVGAFIFILFVMILERKMHNYLLLTNPSTSSFLENPWAYAIYGSLAAGIYEECGRFLAYITLLKRKRNWSDGVAFGIGHGGIEAVLIGGITAIQNLILSININSGNINALNKYNITPNMIEMIKSNLINTPSYVFLVSGIERVFAILIQIGLSILVLQGVRNKKYIYLLYAILLHALIDFPAAFFQKGVITNIWVIEAWVAIMSIVLIVFTLRAKSNFIGEGEEIKDEI
ncbi:YhfC family intramembrane metalloprotease [uncultured Clostridium sp.]|uniref:YhfC family intramembrane metalloprotease n=1 Tax=uncultured Clostridium sp. TaxID=59620 RepID=UPI0028E19498|nr:YhfC family intramembrane metalloprotease [uncultured Clostridium sp.]